MKNTIVYYHPREIRDHSNRASEIRVKKMLDAFRRLDYEVIVVAGSAKIRHQKIRRLKSDVHAGLKIEYVYGESTNAPIMFADKKFTPSNCAVDYIFFSWLKKKHIPFGLFYRDIHWRFGFLKQQLTWPLSILLKPLYYLDWFMYDKYCDILFLPSESMNLHLPRRRSQNDFQELPPGFDTSIAPRPCHDIHSSTPLKLLYVGGLEPTVYDISQLIKVISRRADVQMTICCRLYEWELYRHLYEPYMSESIQVVHVSSGELTCYYHDADVFLMAMSHTEYMDFAMPLKLFEAIGYSVPIVSMNYREVARKIRSAGIGWVVQEFDELDNLLAKVTSNRLLLAEKHEHLLNFRVDNRWDSRATAAGEYLTHK